MIQITDPRVKEVARYHSKHTLCHGLEGGCRCRGRVTRLLGWNPIVSLQGMSAFSIVRAVARYARYALAWEWVPVLLEVGLLRRLRPSRIVPRSDSGMQGGRRHGCNAITRQDGFGEVLVVEALLLARTKIQAKLWDSTDARTLQGPASSRAEKRVIHSRNGKCGRWSLCYLLAARPG